MKVRYTRTASRQVAAAAAAAVDYLAEQSPQAARGLKERLFAVLALLQAQPDSARMTSKRNIRRFPLGSYPYLLDYSADADEIIIRRFRHTSRRPIG